MTANPWPLAASLAQPVVHGYLSRTEADIALLNAAFQARRGGSPYEPLHVYRGLRHILDLHIERQEQRRAIAEMRMKRRLRPLIELRKPRNVLLAEAHDVNGSEGFPFPEEDVADITAGEVSRAVRARRFSHVR